MTSPVSATVVVELTSPGRAAVAVVLVAGPETLRSVGMCFAPRNGRTVAEIPIGRIVLGRWGGPNGEELILCRQSEEQIEIHCHGGTAAVESIISRLMTEGCQRITWQDWFSRSSPNGIQAAAQIALANAVTERTTAILVDQLNGALAEAVLGIIGQVSAANWSNAAEKIDELLRRQELGLHLIKPWHVVVCGAPNVGKSSLINSLAGFERAIVSAIPGTTRDVVTVATAIDGWPVQLSDTAGFRATQDELESAGIELAKAALSRAELAIFVYDATQLNAELADEDTEGAWLTLNPHMRKIHVLNKIDLVSIAERPELPGRLTKSQSDICNLHTASMLTGEGVAGLMSSISRSLVPVSVPAGSAVPFTIEQVDRLDSARADIERRDAAAALESLHALLMPASNLRPSSS